MKKFVSCLIATFMLFSSVFAYTGLMSGEEDIRVTKTKWFDIIYPAACEQSATILYENADAIYEEIGEQYGFPPKFRMPVVICSKTEVFNGYMATGPYNHIVLYDTAMIEDLAVFSETFLNLFRHECIHAYTFNMKNKFWTAVAKVMGDPLNFAAWHISMGMAESATVSGESAAGEGRLNDEYAKQMVKQAKIEGSFPDYWDVQGTADIYPSGSFYYFNGAFVEWLQTKYGMDKYAMFWYKCVNFQAITTGRAFKKVYGVSIRDAWKQYEEEYPVADVASNPVYAGEAQDFFRSGTLAYSPKNDQGSLFSHLSVSETGIAYMDDTCSKVFYVPFEDLSKDEIKPKCLFQDRFLASISFSKDGRFITAGCYDYSSANARYVTKIYDMETGKIFKVKDHGMYEPSIVKADGEYYLVRQGYTSPCYYTSVAKINFNSNGSIDDITETAKYDFELNIAPFSYTDLGDGTFAYIKKDGVEYSIEVVDLNLNEIASYESPKNRMVIRYLSYDDGKLLFSWTAPNTMPRLGSLNLEDGAFSLQEEDVSGGVYYPVAIPDSEDVAYVGNFYRENRLFTTDASDLSEIYNTIAPEDVASADDDEEETETEETAEIAKGSLQYEEYNQFKYYTKGYWFPVSQLKTTSYAPDYVTQYGMDMGATYYTSNPWDADSLTFTAGWSNIAATGALGVSYSSGNGPGTLAYTLEGTTEFNTKGWKKVTGYVDVREQYPLFNGWLLGEVLSQVNFGKTDEIASTSTDAETLDELIDALTPGAAVSNDRSNTLYWASGVLGGYSNITRSGPGKYEYAGGSIMSTFYYTYFKNVTYGAEYYSGVDLQTTLKVYIPKLLPLNCPFGVSYNLPAKLTVSVLPSGLDSSLDSNSGYSWVYKVFHTNNSLVTARFDVLGFGMDIQKATFIRWLYLKDVQFTASYAGIFADRDPAWVDARFLKVPTYINKAKNGEIKYEDYACVRATLNFAPNVGRLGSAVSYSFFIESGYAGLAGESKYGAPIVTLGLGAALF